MKTKIIFECEICKRQFWGLDAKTARIARQDCHRCESQGVPDIGQYPIGLMFQEAENSFYAGIVFAIGHVYIQNGHHLSASFWAARRDSGKTKGVGDNYDDLCGDGHYLMLDPSHGHLNPWSPEARRMVDALAAKGIQPRVWNGHEIVTLADYVLEWERNHK